MKLINLLMNKELVRFDVGDWGLGIGDWAQSPIPIIMYKC